MLCQKTATAFAEGDADARHCGMIWVWEWVKTCQNLSEMPQKDAI